MCMGCDGTDILMFIFCCSFRACFCELEVSGDATMCMGCDGTDILMFIFCCSFRACFCELEVSGDATMCMGCDGTDILMFIFCCSFRDCLSEFEVDSDITSSWLPTSTSSISTLPDVELSVSRSVVEVELVVITLQESGWLPSGFHAAWADDFFALVVFDP